MQCAESLLRTMPYIDVSIATHPGLSQEVTEDGELLRNVLSLPPHSLWDIGGDGHMVTSVSRSHNACTHITLTHVSTILYIVHVHI